MLGAYSQHFIFFVTYEECYITLNHKSLPWT